MFDSLTDLQSSQTSLLPTSPSFPFDSLTDLQSSQTTASQILFGNSLIPLLIYKALKRIKIQKNNDTSLIPLLIYKALKPIAFDLEYDTGLIPLLIYKALKREIQS